MICFIRFAIVAWMATGFCADQIWSQEVTKPNGNASSETTGEKNGLSASDLKHYYARREVTVGFLDGQAAFAQLKPVEKCKVHFLSRASWLGALIDFYQTSPESPLIFVLLQNIFRSDQISTLQGKAAELCRFTATDWDSLLAYAATFYDNMGNYFNYGMNKFIPELNQTKLDCFVNYVAKQSGNSTSITAIWNKVKDLIFNLDKQKRQIGLTPDGITTYFSANCDAGDAQIVKAYLESKNAEAWNSRVIKTVDKAGQQTYEIRFASVQTSNNGSVDGIPLGVKESYKGHTFLFTRGDFSPLLVRAVNELALARACVDGSLEQSMTDYLMASFLSGSLTAHKNASRLWVMDKNPVIESYIGFIETYQDPDGMRGSFEGFVAVVDKENSAVLGRLVQSAESLLPLLPWPRQLEKDQFSKPDFTDLTVIAFGNGGPPAEPKIAGINIPNYNEIRQAEGFKNVHLGNMVTATLTARPVQYLTKEDAKILTAGRLQTFEIIVALHELLGHGSGKLLFELPNGNLDFNVKEIGTVDKYGPVTSWYKPGQTYETKFGKLGNTLEECRAETVATYLSLFPEVMAVWGLNETQAEHYAYLLWLEEASSGIEGLAEYKPETDTWGEAHAQGNFAILRVMLESGAATVDLVNNSADGKPDLLVKLDRKRIRTDGKRFMGQFLLGLQYFRSTGDAERAQAFYSSYTSLKLPENQKYMEWYHIAIERKQPRTLVVQHNSVANSELFIDAPNSCQPANGVKLCFPKIDLKSYNATLAGMIQSFSDRFSDVSVEAEMLALADADWEHFLA